MKKSRTILWIIFLSCSLAWMACGEKASNGLGTQVALDSTGSDTTNPEVRLALINEQLKYGPENWNLWYQRSLVFYEMGNLPRAMEDIEKSIQYSITEPETYHMRGFYYYVQKQDSAALRDFQRAADLNSENPETYYQIGNVYFFRQNWEKAEEAYNHAIKLDSLEPTYVFAKGLMRRKQGQVEQAIINFDAALKSDPTFVKALLALHDIYLEEKHNPDQAYLFNERVMLIDSTQPLAHFNQGNFFMVRASKVKNPDKSPDYQVLMKVAISEYTQCLTYDPKFVQGLYNRGYCNFLLKRFNLALDDFSKVIELDPFHRDAFYMKANIQEFQGDITSALSNYERSLEIDSKFIDAAIAVKELRMKVKGVEVQ